MNASDNDFNNLINFVATMSKDTEKSTPFVFAANNERKMISACNGSNDDILHLYREVLKEAVKRLKTELKDRDSVETYLRHLLYDVLEVEYYVDYSQIVKSFKEAARSEVQTN